MMGIIIARLYMQQPFALIRSF